MHSRRFADRHESATLECMQRQRGFTLIEIVIVVVIVALLSAIIVLGFPTARDRQHLRLAEQAVQAAVRDAQNRALNELRDEECLDRQVPETFRHCSDVGIAFTDSGLRMFADTDDPDGNEYSAADYHISTIPLPGTARVVTDRSIAALLWEISPPTVTLYADGVIVTDQAAVVLASREARRTVAVQSYGHVNSLPNE